MKKVALILIVIIIIIAMPILIYQKHENNKKNEEMTNTVTKNIENITTNSIETTNSEENGILKTIKDIKLRDLDGKESNYLFTYKDEEYKAIYTKDNWKIINSYKIQNENDIAIICQALIDIHPIHGRDMKSYRKIDDLVFEWLQHNLMYYILPEDNTWKNNAKDVDLDPADQGKNLNEIYESRTGKKITDIIQNIKK